MKKGSRARGEDHERQQRRWARERETYEELLVLGGLDGALLGKALDDGDGLLELGLGHLCSRGGVWSMVDGQS